MQCGDKFRYTDKQERKADHIAESYGISACPTRRPSAEPGRPSTRTMAAARRPAAPGKASLPVIPPRQGGSVAEAERGRRPSRPSLMDPVLTGAAQSAVEPRRPHGQCPMTEQKRYIQL
jgi:hypothetical protein